MDNYLRLLVDCYEVAQKTRIQFGNRLDSVFREVNCVTDEENQFLIDEFGVISDRENYYEKLIIEHGRNIPIINALSKVKGIGFLSAAKLIAYIDIDRCAHTSSLWRYCGYGINPETGCVDKPVKGEKLTYNKRAKRATYLIAVGMIRANSPYKSIYDNAKIFYNETKPDWSRMHVHRAALRKMIKVFLSHIYHVWKKLDGHDVDMPYVIEKMGHKHYIPPEDYGWVY